MKCVRGGRLPAAADEKGSEAGEQDARPRRLGDGPALAVVVGEVQLGGRLIEDDAVEGREVEVLEHGRKYREVAVDGGKQIVHAEDAVERKRVVGIVGVGQRDIEHQHRGPPGEIAGDKVHVVRVVRIVGVALVGGNGQRIGVEAGEQKGLAADALDGNLELVGNELPGDGINKLRIVAAQLVARYVAVGDVQIAGLFLRD